MRWRGQPPGATVAAQHGKVVVSAADDTPPDLGGPRRRVVELQAGIEPAEMSIDRLAVASIGPVAAQA
jgi:hypothetical protein